MRSAKGSIIKLGKDHYRVQISVVDPVTGRRLRPSENVRGSARKAEDVKIKMLAAANAGEYGSMMLLKDYVDAIFYTTLKAKRPRSIECIKDRIRLYVLSGLGSTRLSDITPKILRSWLATFPDDKKRLVAYTTIRQVLNSAVKNEYLVASPVSKVDKPEPEPYEPEVLDIDEIRVYLWHFRDTAIEAAILIALGVGFRRGEIIALDVSDVNMATGRINVDNAITQHGSQIYEGDPKGKKGKREPYMPQVLLARLIELLQGRSGAILKTDNKRMKPDCLTKTYERLIETLPDGVKRVPFKNLRHSSHTLAYDVTGDIFAVQVRGGWTNIKTPTDYYVRPKGNRDREVASAMNKALSLVPKSANRCQKDRFTKTFKVVSEF